MLSARTRPLSRGRAFRAGFRKPNARNGTQPEPRRKHNFIYFQNSPFIDTSNCWKISSFKNSKLNLIISLSTKRHAAAGMIGFPRLGKLKYLRFAEHRPDELNTDGQALFCDTGRYRKRGDARKVYEVDEEIA